MRRLRLHRPRRGTISPRRLAAALAAALCGWVVFAVYAEMATGSSVDQRAAQLRADNDRLRREIADRHAEIGQAGTQAWLEEQARRLGYVKPGEQVFVLTTPGQPVPPGGGIDATPMAPIATPSPSAAPPPTPSPAPAPAATPGAVHFSLSPPPPR